MADTWSSSPSHTLSCCGGIDIPAMGMEWRGLRSSWSCSEDACDGASLALSLGYWREAPIVLTEQLWPQEPVCGITSIAAHQSLGWRLQRMNRDTRHIFHEGQLPQKMMLNSEMLQCTTGRQLVLPPFYTRKNKDLEVMVATLHALQWVQMSSEAIHIEIPLGMGGARHCCSAHSLNTRLYPPPTISFALSKKEVRAIKGRNLHLLRFLLLLRQVKALEVDSAWTLDISWLPNKPGKAPELFVFGEE